MKLGIMQPYFLPYIGYWQLMNHVDKYIIYDDVNYIKGGWINRNRILSNGTGIYFNIPLLDASPNKLIKDIKVNFNEKSENKALKAIKGCYSKAPFFNEVYPLLCKIIQCKEKNLALFLKNSIQLIAEYLQIKTEFLLSSELEKNSSLRGQDKVIHICKILGASEYYNAYGGQNLYSYQDFQNNDIKLKFIKTSDIEYPQLKNEFVPYLSIIDVLMFNSKASCIEFLNQFEVIDNHD